MAFAALIPATTAPSVRAEDDPALATSSTDAPALTPEEPTTTQAPSKTTAPPIFTPAAAPPSGPGNPSKSALPSYGTGANTAKNRAQRVNAVVAVGNVGYLGGEFTKMVSPSGGDSVSRGYLAAVDGKTGKLTSWNPKANGKVWALELADDGESVYVGGDFSKIGDKSVSRIARVSLETGKVDTSFKPKSVSGRVRALALAGDRLYVGGEFKTVAGQARPKLAALDADSGSLLSWTPPPLGPGRYLGHTGIPTLDYDAGHVFAVDVVGGTVYAGGTFLDLGGRAALAAIDAGSGLLEKLQYEPERPIFDLEAADDMLYAVSGGPGGRVYAYGPKDRWPDWRAKFDGDAVGVAVSDDAVYVAGHYDYIVSEKSSCYQLCPGGPSRRHLAAFDRDNGKLLPWNPEADTSTGPYAAAVGDKTLFVGGEFTKINGKSQPGFAIFPDS